MPHPAISLVINAYNRADFISAALGSALAQTRKDFELILWDDGSTDNTVEIARRMAGDDPRVRIIQGDHAGGVISLHNAIKLARAPYLCWIDSDDAIAPNCFAATADILDTNPAVGMVYTGYVVMNEKGKVLGAGKRCGIPYSKERLLTDFMTFHFRMMRRSVFDAVGGLDHTMPCSADYDLCLKLSEATQIEYLNQPLYFYRIHDRSISQLRRLDQIKASQEAIERAIARRGLSNEYELQVQLVGRFKLRRKNAPTGLEEDV